ncbi:hypothetical protein ACLKA7_007001 [Drosophila subpalustris]
MPPNAEFLEYYVFFEQYVNLSLTSKAIIMDRELNVNGTEVGSTVTHGKFLDHILKAAIQLFKWLLSNCCSYVDPENILQYVD